jgi:hypothetical protein
MLIKISRISAIAIFSASAMPAAGVAIASAILAVNQPSRASSSDFFCAVQQGIPTTFTRTSDGGKLPVVRWTSGLGGVSARDRCTVVSRRFQKNYDNGTLRTIISGKINKQAVVCGAVSTNDGCSQRTVLFTLDPGSNPRRVVESLFNQPALLAGEIQNQSGDNSQIAIDFESYLSALKKER